MGIKFDMNVIFGLIFTLSSVILLFISPNSLLTACLSGGQKALDLSLKMVVIYGVWLGIFALVEKTKGSLFGKLIESTVNTKIELIDGFVRN